MSFRDILSHRAALQTEFFGSSAGAFEDIDEFTLYARFNALKKVVINTSHLNDFQSKSICPGSSFISRRRLLFQHIDSVSRDIDC